MTAAEDNMKSKLPSKKQNKTVTRPQPKLTIAMKIGSKENRTKTEDDTENPHGKDLRKNLRIT